MASSGEVLVLWGSSKPADEKWVERPGKNVGWSTETEWVTIASQPDRAASRIRACEDVRLRWHTGDFDPRVELNVGLSRSTPAPMPSPLAYDKLPRTSIVLYSVTLLNQYLIKTRIFPV